VGRVPTSGSVFEKPAFRQYFIGQAFSYIGDSFRVFVIPLLVFKITGSAFSTALTYVFEFLPMALAGLLGGSLADRLDRRKTMIACDFIRSLLLGTIAALFYFKLLSLVVLLAAIVVISAAASIFLSGQAASIPYLVGKQRSTQAIAVLLGVEKGATIIVPPIGGALFGLFGPLPALIANAVTYVISQCSLALVPAMGPETKRPLPSLRELSSDIRDGFQFMLADDILRQVTIWNFITNSLGMVTVAVMIPFLKSDLHASDQSVGLFFGLSACGAVLGSVFAARTATRWTFGKAVVGSQAFEALAVLPLFFTHSIWLAAGAWALTIGATQVKGAQLVGWRLRVTPHELTGRVFAAIRVAAVVGIAIGAYAGGLLASHIGPRRAIIATASLYLLISLLGLFWRSLRNESR